MNKVGNKMSDKRVFQEEQSVGDISLTSSFDTCTSPNNNKLKTCSSGDVSNSNIFERLPVSTS